MVDLKGLARIEIESYLDFFSGVKLDVLESFWVELLDT